MNSAKSQNLNCVLLLSLSFFTLFLAFFSTVSITSKMLKENGFKNLGFYSVGTLYFCFSTGCLFSPTLTSIIKDKRLLQLSGFTITLWICSGLLTAANKKENNQSELEEESYFIPTLVILASVIQGFGSSILWVTAGKYLADCIRICQNNAGRYNGIFWTLTLGSQIFSFLLNSIILGNFSLQTLYIITGVISLIAVLLFGFLPDPVQPIDYRPPAKDPAIVSITNTIKKFGDIKMMKLYGLFINSGTAGGVGQGMLVPFYCRILSDHTLADQLKISSLIMIVYGFGCIFGSHLIGYVNDKLGGCTVVTKVTMAIQLLTYAFLFLCNELFNYNILCYLSALFLGLANNAQNTQISIILTVEFNKAAPAFGVQNIIKNLQISLIQIIATQVVLQTQYRAFYIIFGIINVASQLIVLYTFQFNKIVKEQPQLEQKLNPEIELESQQTDSKLIK